tara:strand:- start:1529 stop:1756 length:228 start_codon:yes stop_codon:yes gene_type:complete
MSKDGTPVLHLYIVFVLACIIYGCIKTNSYISSLEDLIETQNEAIKAQQIENQYLQNQINYYTAPQPLYRGNNKL